MEILSLFHSGLIRSMVPISKRGFPKNFSTNCTRMSLQAIFPLKIAWSSFFCKRKLILHEDKMAYLVHLEQYGVLVFSMNWAAFYNGRNIFHIRDVTRQEIPFVVAVKTAGILQGIQIIYLLAGHRLFCNFYSFLFPQIFVEMKIVFCKLVVVVYSA